MTSKFFGWILNSLTKIYLILAIVLVGCTSQDTEVSRVRAMLYLSKTENAATSAIK